MQKVFISREWPSNYHELLQDRGVEASVWPEYDVPTHAEFCDASRGAAAIVSTIEDPIDGAVMDAAGRGLRIIAQAGVGFDNIDIEAARQRKVWVTNAPGVLDECTADLAFALLMAVARRLPEAVDYVREDKWSGWHPSLLAGAELHGATIGVVGLGRIGAAFARRCEGFGMRILYTARSAKPEAEARGYEHASLERLLAESDFVSLNVPLTPETRGLIGERELEIMKPTAILVNTARGAVVDTDALVRAVSDKQIAGAGLDVTDPEPMRATHPAVGDPRIVVLPHIGSAGLATRRKMYELALQNVMRVFDGQNPLHALVTPQTEGQ